MVSCSTSVVFTFKSPQDGRVVEPIEDVSKRFDKNFDVVSS